MLTLTSKNFVKYARNSRHKNTVSLEEQKKRMFSYTNAKVTSSKIPPKQIKDIVFEETLSGYSEPLHKRTALLALMEYVCENPGIQVLVVDSISRLSRSVTQGAFLIHWFFLKDIVIYDLDYLTNGKGAKENPSLSWEYQRVLYQRLIEAEGYYHSHIKQEDEKAYFSGTTSPLGYRAEGGRHSVLTKDEAIRETIHELFAIAIKGARSLLGEHKRDKSINYAKLWKIVSQNPQFEGLQQELTKQGAKKNLRNYNSFVSFIQSPYYAGYSECSKQNTKSKSSERTKSKQSSMDRVHEYYISETEFNLLNKGFRSINRSSHAEDTYISLIKCSCGKGNLNKVRDMARCRKCNQAVREAELADALAETLRQYYISMDGAFVNKMLWHFRKDKITRLLSSINEAMQPYIQGGEACIEGFKSRYEATSPTSLGTAMTQLMKVLQQYHENNYGEMAVEWIEAYQKGKGRSMLQHYGLEFTYDINSRHLTLHHNNQEIVRHNNPSAMEEIHAIIDNRQSLRHDVESLIDKMPGLKAVLQYDVGFTGGDFWTSFSDYITP